MEIDDILDNPHKFGMPTMDEFRKNPTRWVGKETELFDNIEKGSSLIRAYVKRHIYFVEGVRCRSLEDAERQALNLGLRIKEMDYVVDVVPESSYKCNLHVRLFKKESLAKRQGW